MSDTAAGSDAIRAWVRLDASFAAFNKDLRSRFGVTGGQLALLRIVAEYGEIPLAHLRHRLAMHPATLGQQIDRIARLGLMEVRQSPADGRARLLRLTRRGHRLLVDAPLAGPVRLRSVDVSTQRARRLADAFGDAVDVFGLQDWAPR